MATQIRKQPIKKLPETPRKARQRQPSTSGEEDAAATSLPPDAPDELSIVKGQLAQLTQAMATVQAQLQRQPNPLLQSPSRSQQRRMATPEPDLD
jgi:hypothetical protein